MSGKIRKRNSQKTMTKPKPSVRISLQSGAWKASLPTYRATIGTAVRRALAHEDVPGAVNVALMDDADMQALNHQFRGKNKPTNVLSFPSDEPGELGDIALALETIMAEASAQKKSLAAHLTHLVVHGALHLLGYDHEETADAEMMESIEIAILARMGIENPYVAG